MSHFAPKDVHTQKRTDEYSLQRVLKNLSLTLERDELVQQTLQQIRTQLAVDRVVLYYFYQQWKGQVTSEALSTPQLSIIGSTGADECFNDEYAALYLDGRIRAIDDIESAQLGECHKDFLRGLQVQSNLVVPVLTKNRLWGLLIAHQCYTTRCWSSEAQQILSQAAASLATAPSVQGS